MGLLRCPLLRRVDFSDNAVSLGGAKSLIPFLVGCSWLSDLRLNNTGVGSAGGEVRFATHVQAAAMCDCSCAPPLHRHSSLAEPWFPLRAKGCACAPLSSAAAGWKTAALGVWRQH